MIHTRVSVELTSIFINSISGYVQKCHTYFRSIHCNIKHINTKDFLILQKLFLYRQLKRRPSFLNASHIKYKLLYDFIYLYFYAATTISFISRVWCSFSTTGSTIISRHNLLYSSTKKIESILKHRQPYVVVKFRSMYIIDDSRTCYIKLLVKLQIFWCFCCNKQLDYLTIVNKPLFLLTTIITT